MIDVSILSEEVKGVSLVDVLRTRRGIDVSREIKERFNMLFWTEMFP